MTLQELDSKIEMLDQAIDALRNDRSYESGREAVKLMTEMSKLSDLRSIKMREYYASVPGLIEKIEASKRFLDANRLKVPGERHASDHTIQQIVEHIRQLEAELAAKLGGDSSGGNAQFLPGTIVQS